jgi:DNA-binding CsgD family transcriptional regulator
VAHVIFFSFFFTLIIGTLVAFYVFQVRKLFDDPFLGPLFGHTVLYNVGIFCALLVLYSNLNLGEGFVRSLPSAVREVMIFLVSWIEIALVYFVLRINLGFFQTDIRPRLKRILTGVSALYILSFCLKLCLPAGSRVQNALNEIHYYVFDNFIVLELVVLVVFLFRMRVIQDRGLARIGRAFGLIYVGRYGVIIALSGIFLLLGSRFPGISHATGFANILLYAAIAAAILVSFSLAPLLWLKFFFRKYAQTRSAARDDLPALERLYEEFEISKREQEILEMILEGKNNREIDKALFISYHTVKNHVYNIYQKLGVRNRYQLMSLINSRRFGSRSGPRP